MAEYIRARSSEQKKERMNEIMEVTDHLFTEKTYHDITLTTIATSLGWSRGNLYKYVTTKEEIFLELYLEKQKSYFEDLKAAFAGNNHLSKEEFAHTWAHILDLHHDYLKYYGILATIIETNVALERLVEFKRSVMNGVNDTIHIIEHQCGLSLETSSELFWAFLYHATGLNNGCTNNPKILEAMRIAGIPPRNVTFTDSIYGFILMCLKGSC